MFRREDYFHTLGDAPGKSKQKVSNECGVSLWTCRRQQNTELWRHNDRNLTSDQSFRNEYVSGQLSAVALTEPKNIPWGRTGLSMGLGLSQHTMSAIQKVIQYSIIIIEIIMRFSKIYF